MEHKSINHQHETEIELSAINVMWANTKRIKVKIKKNCLHQIT